MPNMIKIGKNYINLDLVKRVYDWQDGDVDVYFASNDWSVDGGEGGTHNHDLRLHGDHGRALIAYLSEQSFDALHWHHRHQLAAERAVQ